MIRLLIKFFKKRYDRFPKEIEVLSNTQRRILLALFEQSKEKEDFLELSDLSSLLDLPKSEVFYRLKTLEETDLIRCTSYTPLSDIYCSVTSYAKSLLRDNVVKKLERNVSQKKARISILFWVADPTDLTRLRLGEEFREIQERLRSAKLREKFNIEQRTSIRTVDITQSILDFKPQIIHFSGHGLDSGELCFENIVGKVQLVEPDALAALFEEFKDHINCVILNACYSEIQANAISKCIPYVIGMDKAIGDKAAIAFSVGFYQGIGAGKKIEEAFRLGCVQIRLEGVAEYSTPVLIQNEDL